MYDLVWFGFIAFEPVRLFNADPSLYICINYICYNLVYFYGISTIIGYLTANCYMVSSTSI